MITTFHGYDIRLGLEEGTGIYKRLFRAGDLFLSICDYNYRQLMSFGLDKKKIVIHPVGINLNIFPFKRLSEGFTAGKRIKVLTVARLVRVKALDNGIKAIHKLLQENPALDLEYNIVGDGYLTEELNSLIHALDLDKIVHLLGPKNQNEVMEVMGESHIFILPSDSEALPVVLMEAQAIGLPVIATDVGVKEVIVNEESGFCVPAKDVDALAGKLKVLITHPEIWTEMGKRGRKHIEDNFDINKLNDRLVNLFMKILNPEERTEKSGKAGGKQIEDDAARKNYTLPRAVSGSATDRRMS